MRAPPRCTCGSQRRRSGTPATTASTCPRPRRWSRTGGRSRRWRPRSAATRSPISRSTVYTRRSAWAATPIAMPASPATIRSSAPMPRRASSPSRCSTRRCRFRSRSFEDLRFEERLVARGAEPPADRHAAGQDELAEAALRVHRAAARYVAEVVLGGVAPALGAGALQRALAVVLERDLGPLGWDVERGHDLAVALRAPACAGSREQAERRPEALHGRAPRGGAGGVRVRPPEHAETAEQAATRGAHARAAREAVLDGEQG